MVTICPILELVSSGLAWLFLRGNDFPCLDCTLCGVSEMHARRDKLEVYLVFFECFAEFFTAFIVEDVKCRGVDIGLELEKKRFPTGCEFCCLAGLDWV